MRKRYVRIRYIFFGIFLLALCLVVFTRVFVPVQRIIIDTVGDFIWAYQEVRSMGVSQVNTPGSFPIISKRSDEFQNVILVSGDISPGSRAIVANALVGNVIESGNHIAKVQLIGSPGVGLDGVFIRSGIPARFEGRGAGILETKVPRGSDVVVGDAVYQDVGEVLLVGVVGQIIDVSSDPFLTVRIVSAINLTTLQAIERFL